MERERILVVDDEPGVRSALEGILRDEGFEVVTVDSGEEGLAALGAASFDAMLLDIWLPGKDGIDTLLEIRERRIDTEVVMISGHGTIETAVRATKLGAFDFIEKPLSLDRTLLVLRNALRQRRLERRNRRLLEQLARDTEIVGESRAVEEVRARVLAAASSDAPVLISGERGSGRELAARRLHASSARADEPFVAVPCAALDPPAAREALFGALAQAGRIRLAERGSLLLAEAERLDPELQARIAALFDRARKDAPDVRLLASVGPDPARLEPSLLARLSVVRIRVPPLRERREDVPLLAQRFLRDLSREYGRPEKAFDAACLRALVRYSWPGNVSELRNLVEGLLLLATGEVLGVAELPEELGGARPPAEDLYREFDSLARGMKAFERYYVQRVLSEERGDRAAAATRLGLSLRGFEARLRRLARG